MGKIQCPDCKGFNTTKRGQRGGSYRIDCRDCKSGKSIPLDDIVEKGDKEANEINDNTILSGEGVSVDDILEKYNIDTDLWEVEWFTIKDGKHEVSMNDREQDLDFEKDPEGKQVMTGYAKRKGQITKENKSFSIQVKLKRKVDYTDIIVNKLIEKIPKFEFTHFKPQHKQGSGIALEMATLDAHFGKLAWLAETGYRIYDTDSAGEDYEYAVDKNLNWSSPYKLDKIYFIVGQDLFHIDNVKGNTTYGSHDMDVDGRIIKIYDKTYEIVLRSIYKCRSVAPVEVIWSPGNHDFLTSYALCHSLAQHFIDDKYVDVDLYENKGGVTRKARLWGNLLVGWTHRIVGKENTWGNELAQAFPKLWGDSIFREWHCGDQHKKKTTKTMPEFTSGGVLIRQITALSPVDKWHFENAFTDAVPGGEAFLWSKDCGVFSTFAAWTGQYEDYRNKLINKVELKSQKNEK